MKRILAIILGCLVVCLVVVLISTSVFATTAQGSAVLKNPFMRLWNAIHNLQGQLNSGEIQTLASRVAALESKSLPDCIIDADCNDNDPCTAEVCDSARGCVYTDDDSCSGSAGGSGSGTTGQMVITEFMFNPAAVSDTYGEWLELYNSGDSSVNLNGWSIKDQGTDSYTFSDNIVVMPNDYVVLCKNTDTSVNGQIPCDASYSSFTLGNTADSIILADPASVAIDQISYDATVEPWKALNQAGYSLQLDASSNDAVSNDDGANWCNPIASFGLGDFGTPGEINGVC